MRAAILLPALLVVLGALRALLSVADGGQLRGGNTELHQIVPGFGRAAIAQSEVVLGRSAFIAMALHGDLGALKILEDVLERRGILAQRGTRIRPQSGLVVVEKGVPGLRTQQLAERFAGRSSGYGRSRRRHGNSCNIFRGAAGPFSGKGVRGARIWKNFAAGVRLHGPHTRLHRYAGGVLNRPAQRGRLTPRS